MESQVRDKYFIVRVSRDELATLKAKASEHNLTGSDLVRIALKEFYEKAA